MPILKFYSPFKHFSVLFKCRYSRKMHKCEGVTKYKCLECFTFVCNICSKFKEDHDIYNDEEKLIGKCEDCDGNQVAVKRKSDNKHKTKTKTKQKIKNPNKLMNIIRHNKNLLTVTE